MLIVPVYRIKNYSKFKKEFKKFEELSQSFLARYNKVFFVKDKYIIFGKFDTEIPCDSLTFIIHWLSKQKIIKLHCFVDSNGHLISKHNNPEMFNVYKELLLRVQSAKTNFTSPAYNVNSGVKVLENPTQPFVVGFDVKTILDNGVRKVLLVKVYYSYVPTCDLNKCYEDNLYSLSSSIFDGDLIVTINKGEIKYISPDFSKKCLDFSYAETTVFTIRDIILLLALQKYIPYYKHSKGDNNEDFKEFVNNVIKHPKVPSIIKGLVLSNPDEVYFDGQKLVLSYQDIGELIINLQKVKSIVYGRIPIVLAKYMALSGSSYDELTSIQAPQKLSQLFIQTDGKIDYGMYAKVNDLLVPLHMELSDKFFITLPLLCSVTLYGLLKGWLPYTVEGDGNILINYDNKVGVEISPTPEKIHCRVTLFKNSKYVAYRSYSDIKTNKKVLKELHNLIISFKGRNGKE